MNIFGAKGFPDGDILLLFKGADHPVGLSRQVYRPQGKSGVHSLTFTRQIVRAESRLRRQALFQTGAGLSKPNANEMGAQTGEMTELFGTVDSTV